MREIVVFLMVVLIIITTSCKKWTMDNAIDVNPNFIGNWSNQMPNSAGYDEESIVFKSNGKFQYTGYTPGGGQNNYMSGKAKVDKNTLTLFGKVFSLEYEIVEWPINIDTVIPNGKVTGRLVLRGASGRNYIYFRLE